MDQYLLLVFASFLAAFVVTPLIGRLARHTGFVDEPQPHKMHVRPIPLLGGLAIYLALGVLLFGANLASDWVEVAAVGIGGTLLMLVGLWDDRRGIAPRLKLLAQVAAGLIAAAAGIQVHLFPWPAVNLLITIFWFVGITNAINLMDNMDGLAAGVCAVSGAFFAVLAASAGQTLIASLAAAVTGASLGFLYYNISPAMVFMGDTGSLLLGFLLAVVGLKYSPETLPLGSTWMVPIVVLGLPIFDTTMVTFARLRARRPISQGGTDHTSHRLARLGLGTNRAVMTLYLVAAGLGAVAILMTRSTPPVATALFAGLLGVALILLIALERARPMPPANPPILFLAEDESLRPAVRAVRGLSSNLTVLLSARCKPRDAKGYLCDLAVHPEPFQAWMESAGEKAVGPMEEWSSIYRLAGIIRSPRTGPDAILFREARLILFGPHKALPEEWKTLLQKNRDRLLLAPRAECPDGLTIPAITWNDPELLTRLLEDTILGYHRKEIRS